ncbi:MAG: rcc01693 family protein [Pseudomonadota bacterium]
MSKSFDWPAMRQRALYDLRLTPDQFWALTPVEFMLMLGLSDDALPMGRAGLERLCREFPDGNGNETNDEI